MQNNISRFTVYCKNKALKTLRKIIEKYTSDTSKTKAGYRLGLGTRTSALTSFNKWDGHGKIPLKYLLIMCNETGHDIKQFLGQDDVQIQGTYSHKEVSYSDVIKLL